MSTPKATCWCSMNTAPARAQNKSFTHISFVLERLASPQFLGVCHAFLLKTSAWEATERLAERVWSLNTNPHSSLFTSVLMGFSLFQSIFLLAPDFRNGLYASLHCTKVWHRAYPECDATLWRSARVYSVNRVQALHSSLLLTGL